MRNMPHTSPALKINAQSCWRQTAPQQRRGLGIMARLGGAAGVLLSGSTNPFQKLLPRRATVTAQEREIFLAAQQLWSGVFALPTRVLCRRGQIWITQTNNGEDYILYAGEEFVASPRTQIIISTFETAAVVKVSYGLNKTF